MDVNVEQYRPISILQTVEKIEMKINTVRLFKKLAGGTGAY